MNNFEKYIKEYLKSYKLNTIIEAMEYAMEGGKRFRPRIIFSILSGMNIKEEVGYDAALALEMIQTYSLIHDDLPAMDNDDMRRGKPSLHKAYREDIAILTGDALLNDAFRVISESKTYNNDTKVKIINCLSKYAGMDGMIYGQLLDVTNNSDTINQDLLDEIQDNKTGGLFKISCLIPMYINNEDNEDYYINLGRKIGIIFQNQDDLFDLIKSEEEMGKLHTDVQNNKGTALSLHSADELKALIDVEFKDLDNYLEKASFNTNDLKELIYKLKNR